MARECSICGKKPQVGHTIATRGVAKSKGGIGKRTTGKTLRKFNPNLQSVNAQINGKNKRIKVCTKCLKAGKVIKAA